MDSINRFIGLRPTLFPDQQETQAKSEQTPKPVVSSGISGTPDAFETFQRGSLDLTPLTTPMASQNNESASPNPTQGESVDASSFFDILTADPGKAEAFKNASTTPDLGGLTQPMKDPGKGSIGSALSPHLSDKATAIVAKTASGLADISDGLNEPDGDMIEMIIGWAQWPGGHKGGVGGSDGAPSRDYGKEQEEKRKAEEKEQHERDLAAQEAYMRKEADSADWSDTVGYPSDYGEMGGPAWMRNREARRVIGSPTDGLHNPTPDGGGDEPTPPSPGKGKAPGSGSEGSDDNNNSGSSGSSPGSYPFVGEGDTIIHPKVNVASESVPGSIYSDFTNAGYTPDPDDGKPTPLADKEKP